MASSDPTWAHLYDHHAAPGVFNCHLGSDLLLRPVNGPYDDDVIGRVGTPVTGMTMPNGRSNGTLPSRGPLADVSSFDMTANVRNFTCEHQSNPLQQYENMQQAYSHGRQSQQNLSYSGATTAPKPIRRRMRMITSCLECRRRKLKCNKSQPCANCLKFSRDCFYLGPKLDEASQLRLTQIKEKVGSLERQLERDVAKSEAGPRDSGGRGLYQQRTPTDDVDGEFDEELDLEITPMVALDLILEDEADGTDDFMYLGARIGKMRLNERFGGSNRPRIPEEIQAGLLGSLPQLGEYSAGLACPRLDPGPPSRPGSCSASAGPDQSLTDFLRPSASYMSPTSGIWFGQFAQSPSLLTFLPTKPAGDRLLEHYFDAVHPIARCVHRPCFQTQYDGFWGEAAAGHEPRSSVQALVFAAWFSAAVAMDEDVINREFGFTKTNLVENMKIATELALSKANFLRATKVETMQAFVMYMVPLCREEVSRAHSVLVGAAVRMAECMGLQRDGTEYNLNHFETHVRRLIWHQLCFLDIRTCEAQGPKPAIRREDYDTCLPNNWEEDQLLPNISSNTSPCQPSEIWTSTLFPLIRFEVNEMMRIVWADRRKLEAPKIILTQALTKIETFRKRMLASYDHLLDESVPIQRYAKLVMHLLLHRLHVTILHPYYTNTTRAMPARLRSVLIMSSIMIIELAMQLDSNPAFRLWRWYAGAYQQYQAALVLATEILYVPAHKEAERIWTCLDYVFELDGNMTTEEKARHILMNIMEKMGAYMSMRKVRAPSLTSSASPEKQAVKAEEAISSPRREAVDSSMPPVSQQTYPQTRSRHLPLKESGMVSATGPGTRSGSLFCLSSSGTSTSVSPLPHRGTPGPQAAMSNYLSEKGSWNPPPPPSQNDSPANSISDSGSLKSVGGQRRCALGGTGTSTSGGAQAHLTGMEWSNYHEKVMNAQVPFDPQTGSFTGFSDLLTRVDRHSGGCTQ